MKTLIADDDAVSCAMLDTILRKLGFDPVIAPDGQTAWNILQQPDAPRLLLLDWSMPDISGTEICRRLCAQPTSNPPYVIMISARDRKSDIVQGFDAGISDYITKPFHTEELRARLMVGKRTLELQTELIAARDLMAHQAMHDALTGVLNRRAIFETLAHELSRARRERRALNIGLYDLDHFKMVNDTHGHQIGDAILKAFARRLQDHTRDYTAVGRYGGEEFLVVVTGTPGALNTDLHQRLCGVTAATPFETDAGPVSVTASVGVAAAGADSTPDNLIARADKALYAAKQAGRNRVCLAENQLTRTT